MHLSFVLNVGEWGTVYAGIKEKHKNCIAEKAFL